MKRNFSILGFFVFIIAANTPIISQITVDTIPIPEFSVTHGFYENNFDVIVFTQLENASIKYTLDCSDPRTSTTALILNSPATIRIDPESTNGERAKTAGVILRACTLIPGDTVSLPVSQTYLFINKIKELSPGHTKPGSNWPEEGSSDGNAIDYGMDLKVLNDPKYQDLIDDALLSIPSISLSTDLKNLFNPDSGIYMNADEDGREWERPASIELINPPAYSGNGEGFQINAGIRIRGGWSRHGDCPKLAFRIFFRSEYGKANLRYPLFGNEGVDEFDKIDLRTSQNYAWSYPGHLGQYNTMNRDVFSRDLQKEMGQPYTRSRYYHLYLNGYYWGLYQTQERAEARYAASYFGGNVEDYDVIKVTGWADPNPYTVEATDGVIDAWKSVWDLCVSGFQNNSNYFKLQGLNEDGSSNPEYNVLVDVDNLINYMMVIFYAGNFDSPTSKFGGDSGPNNFFCIYNRNARDGFKFFAHDAEHSLRTTGGEGPGIGLYENRVDIGMNVNDFSKFHPQWLHYKLTSNKEYKIRFSDHIYKNFFNQGSMTPEKTLAIFLSRAKEIDTAIIAESARWGDTYLNPIGTKDLWQRAVDDIVDNYFPYRSDIVLTQLKNAGLYPDINPPVFVNNDQEILTNDLKIEPGFILKLQNSNGTTGSIQYTLDGNDPRAIGGSKSGSSQDGGDNIELIINEPRIIKARILNGTVWSALHEITLYMEGYKENIKITEIHYHPMSLDTVKDNEYEFIELKNTGTIPIDLSLAFFEKGITFTFPSGSIINPSQFIVLCSNQQQFFNRYGFLAFGEFSAQLDNGGETITLFEETGDTIFSVTYSNQIPWPEQPNGKGFSLVPIEVNPTGDLNDPANWRASYEINGSPGQDDIQTDVENSVNDIPYIFALNQNYPNPFNPSTNISFTIEKSQNVEIKVYDILGNEILILLNEYRNSGNHIVKFNAENLSSGVYYYQIRSGSFIDTKKMVVLK